MAEKQLTPSIIPIQTANETQKETTKTWTYTLKQIWRKRETQTTESGVGEGSIRRWSRPTWPVSLVKWCYIGEARHRTSLDFPPLPKLVLWILELSSHTRFWGRNTSTHDPSPRMITSQLSPSTKFHSRERREIERENYSKPSRIQQKRMVKNPKKEKWKQLGRQVAA